MLKCCMCDYVVDIGYEMPNGDYVCSTHECCYEYCSCEGEKIFQDWRTEYRERIEREDFETI